MHPRHFRIAAAVLVTGLTVTLTIAPPAGAHASVQTYGSTATAGGYGAFFIRIPHGCEGGLSTDRVVVTLPKAFESTRPQLVSGWESKATPGGRSTRVVWSGGDLPDTHFADFGISVKYPVKAGDYPLTVVQHCGDATVRWSGDDAPVVNVVAAAGQGHGHSH